MFVDQENPRGADGLPFTADDGLRPLPNSPFALRGWGALPPVEVVVGQPMAHFRIIDLSGGLGWKDATGYDYDPEWLAALPYDRHRTVRPYRTPEALGSPGVVVKFSAVGSIGGLTSDSIDASGITTFDWEFGDGSSGQTTEPVITHSFQRSGLHTVKLTVTNSLGNSHSTKKTYRVLGGDGGNVREPPSAPSGLRIVSP